MRISCKITTKQWIKVNDMLMTQSHEMSSSSINQTWSRKKWLHLRMLPDAIKNVMKIQTICDEFNENQSPY